MTLTNAEAVLRNILLSSEVPTGKLNISGDANITINSSSLFSFGKLSFGTHEDPSKGLKELSDDDLKACERACLDDIFKYSNPVLQQTCLIYILNEKTRRSLSH